MTSPRQRTRPTTARARPGQQVRMTDWLERSLLSLENELARLPVVAQIHAGTISKETYVRLLQRLIEFHKIAEQRLDQAAHLKNVNRAEFRRGEALRRDLHFLRGQMSLRTVEAVDLFDSNALRWVQSPCLSLAGFLFAAERQRQKPSRRVGPLSKALGLKAAPRHGLDYHIEDSENVARRYRKLCDSLNGGVRRSEQAQEVLTGAQETLRTFIAIYRSLE